MTEGLAFMSGEDYSTGEAIAEVSMESAPLDLRAIRQGLGLSLAALAAKMGDLGASTAATAILSWERIGCCPTAQVAPYARALGLTWEQERQLRATAEARAYARGAAKITQPLGV